MFFLFFSNTAQNSSSKLGFQIQLLAIRKTGRIISKNVAQYSSLNCIYFINTHNVTLGQTTSMSCSLDFFFLKMGRYCRPTFKKYIYFWSFFLPDTGLVTNKNPYCIFNKCGTTQDLYSPLCLSGIREYRKEFSLSAYLSSHIPSSDGWMDFHPIGYHDHGPLIHVKQNLALCQI